LALEVLQTLYLRRQTPPAAWERGEMARHLKVDHLQLEPVLQALIDLDWVGQLEPTDAIAEPRLLLLVDPEQTPLSPLVERLLLPPSTSIQKFWENAQMTSLKLRDALE
jgi:membrane protein